jgi:dienelactone hydrolase
MGKFAFSSPATAGWLANSVARLIYAVTAVWLLNPPSTVQAAIVEEVLTVPVTLKTDSGIIRRDIVVTTFHDDARPKSPYAVISHSQQSAAAKRAAMGRQKYSEISRYLVSLGFSVLVPTRIGYGVTGGPDVEYSGPCNDKDYAVGFDLAAEEVMATLQRSRTLNYVDLSGGIVIGTSFGGMTSVKLATMHVPGLVGAVNFSGGIGGDPELRPGRPCSSFQLDELYGQYGASAKVPSLWLYSPNDRYWGPRLPHQWFQSFIRAGGHGRFIQLPLHEEDGHKIFVGNPTAWKPAFEHFLQEIGFTNSAPFAQ